MRVLLCLRQNCYKYYSADTQQCQKIYKFLKKRNIQVDINNGGKCDFSKYDVVHLFDLNSTGEMYKYYKEAVRNKCDIVISPLYWNYERYFKFNKKIESIKLWKRCNLYRGEILKKSKGVICSSEIEMGFLNRDFGQINGEVVYYGSEIEYDDIPLYSFKERNNLDKYVLCVARINPIKNQKTLVDITEKLGMSLVLVGNIDDKSYFSECMKKEHVKYFGFFDSYNIYNAYRFAEVHAVPGFCEMPGLSTLEAAGSGCKVLTSSEGCAKEYLKDKAYYCNPFNTEDIENKLIEALNGRKSNILKLYVQQRFKWEKYGEKILDIYESL
ncbi:glycosyltransferase family 4 protein [Oceanirhabdus seepicola]|uniref:Glycosyltransferase n=1 Tax=Oceanirhabdus seepicola TaxID=2828781 RepID=A0A9J6P8D8_9CLOT|nr:glycosyltransferase [Oceanirhabdus seepicola]MCM1992468.1 glycosyltransferase [Oceanirhabdus seepicola]